MVTSRAYARVGGSGLSGFRASGRPERQFRINVRAAIPGKEAALVAFRTPALARERYYATTVERRFRTLSDSESQAPEASGRTLDVLQPGFL